MLNGQEKWKKRLFRKSARSKMQLRFLRPEIHTEKKKYEFPTEGQVLKTLIFMGDSYFKIQSLKIGINRQFLI
jgi:hypothetical protein